MEICNYCKGEAKYYDVLEVNGEIEICCNDCFYDLKLDWEELKKDHKKYLERFLTFHFSSS